MKVAGLRSQRFPDLCPAVDGRRDGGMVVTAHVNDKRRELVVKQ
jgi:hypothetical protein